ncbi:hypothetical protein C2E23DRAFT_231381 [Lenzites betulinus]|nr:hypothetical protein C2E23DRAFT_231381 [Lenzites betulinus]
MDGEEMRGAPARGAALCIYAAQSPRWTGGGLGGLSLGKGDERGWQCDASTADEKWAWKAGRDERQRRKKERAHLGQFPPETKERARERGSLRDRHRNRRMEKCACEKTQ